MDKNPRHLEPSLRSSSQSSEDLLKVADQASSIAAGATSRVKRAQTKLAYTSRRQPGDGTSLPAVPR
jgi:hypothetical protein